MLHNTAPPPKPIRFVTNNEGPYAKRRRINSACLTCRRRKTRCSGERPVCQTCIQNKHECGGYGSEAEHVRTTSQDKQDQEKKNVTKSTISANLAKTQTSPIAGTHASNTLNYPQDPRNADPPPLRPIYSAGSDSTNSPDLNRSRQEVGTEDSAESAFSLTTRNRMPYFRYFGPTAIMPGFKQMVVKVKGKQQSTGATSTSDYLGSPSANGQTLPNPVTPQQPIQEAPNTLEIPIYDSSDVPPSPLITHLCETFFSHLGCNYPFLQKERFMKDLEEKQVDAILVDAICAIAARFSTDPMLTGKPETNGRSEKVVVPPEVHRSDHGAAFAQRAKSAITDTFACPSVAYVQAALLLAYDEFGASRDSGLWMYLGIAIRMAQDLGMQTLEGLKYEGRNGPTPQTVKITSTRDSPKQDGSPLTTADEDATEQRSVERERLDTFWAVFFLDRVISSGTGRPVTLRDRDIEIGFPSLDEVDPVTGWPMPFPALIRVIHLYGRVTDLLNGIKEVTHVSPDVLRKLGSMEHQLTDIYHGLSEKLHFSAVNFQHHVKAGQGTNFILLHIWFHTLIVLLHRPTLLKTFEGQIQQLLPNSRELSMSSAKTIADILAFAELIDPKATSGNPFTSQPIYISACAFLKESAALAASSNPQSRNGTPPRIDPAIEDTKISVGNIEAAAPAAHSIQHGKSEASIDQKQVTKHNLLATAANSNYQRCYRGLQSLETYWLGVKYILTVLDQKAKGIGDPLLYTKEEMESALEVPRPEPAFTSPGWRRKLSWGTYLSAQGITDITALKKRPPTSGEGKSGIIDSNALGWSLTGTMNSPSTNIAVLYPTDNQPSTTSTSARKGTGPANKSRNPLADGRPSHSHLTVSSIGVSNTHPSADFSGQGIASEMRPPIYPSPIPTDPSIMSDADLLLSLHSPYSNSSPHVSNAANNQISQTPTYPHSTPMSSGGATNQAYPGMGGPGNTALNFGDMMIESQDIDLSTLTSEDMMPWFEYLPPDLVGAFDGSVVGAAGSGYQGQEAEKRG